MNTSPVAPSEQKPGSTLFRDVRSGLVVSLVAMPLCLGIALASAPKEAATSEALKVPLVAGLISGIIGGLVVGAISGSHTSVSGPAAGLTAVVATQITKLGSWEAFLLAVMIGGLLQIVLGVLKAGKLSAFFPLSVIKGLLAAIGVILILKQIPHIFGDDKDPEGDMSFQQPDSKNTFTELLDILQGNFHLGATAIGLLSIALLVIWERNKRLKQSIVPAPLVVVILGVILNAIFSRIGGSWHIQPGTDHLVEIPIESLKGLLRHPDFSAWNNPQVYVGAVTIAIVASLETLLNLEAVDKLDKQQRTTPGSRELIAQGVGNTLGGLVGALPVTSVIVRGSVNVDSGAATKLSTIVHGFLLLAAVAFVPQYMNTIPLSCLAAILLVTGFKLASPALFRKMWAGGRYQFAPFLVTLLAIVFTDLLVGILIGLGVSIFFILNSNLRQPVRQVVDLNAEGKVLNIGLPQQVSFLNRVALDRILSEAEPGTHVLIDAAESDYVDPDVLALFQDFRDTKGPARGVTVSLRGFRDKHEVQDDVKFASYSTREKRDSVSPQQILEILKQGNSRFVKGQRVNRNFREQIQATARGQNPIAVILSCIDSRVPVEVVFDLGIGDVFTARVAGNVLSPKTLGSLEFGVVVAGARLVVVLGHTRCGAVTSAIRLVSAGKDTAQETGCAHLSPIVDDIAANLRKGESLPEGTDEAEEEEFIDEIARRNVLRTVEEICLQSDAIRKVVEAGQALVVGAMYDVATGDITFLENDSSERENSTA